MLRGCFIPTQLLYRREVFGLPNIKSAKKRVLIGEVRNARNKATKSDLKTAIKKFEAAAAEGNRTEADGAYKVAVKKVDQAVAKGVLHKNTAAHRKSAMTPEAQQDWLIGQTKGRLSGRPFCFVLTKATPAMPGRKRA